MGSKEGEVIKEVWEVSKTLNCRREQFSSGIQRPSACLPTGLTGWGPGWKYRSLGISNPHIAHPCPNPQERTGSDVLFIVVTITQNRLLDKNELEI